MAIRKVPDIKLNVVSYISPVATTYLNVQPLANSLGGSHMAATLDLRVEVSGGTLKPASALSNDLSAGPPAPSASKVRLGPAAQKFSLHPA